MKEKHTAAIINNFAIRCFRDTADRDYIHARLAYHHGLIPQFRWSSLHCLEKYGKCILLLNRISALKLNGKTVGHEILESLDRIKASKKFEIRISCGTRKFMTALEMNASDRYLEYSWHNLGQNVADLDLAVWELRRYCQTLIYTITVQGKKIDLGPRNIKKIECIQKPWGLSNFINGGWLEKVFQQGDNPARAALIKNNLWFSGSRRNSIRSQVFVHSEESPLDLSPEAREEIAKYVRISKRFDETPAKSEP